MRPWIALFSRTGSEIVEISNQLGQWPDLIITNKTDLSNVVEILTYRSDFQIRQIPNNPTVRDYHKFFHKSALITLNGYLRIIPAEICDSYEIYNGHPGLITKYPVLKGRDPQQKAFDLYLPTSGSVIHRATREVDSGKVIASREIGIIHKKLPEVFEVLHKNSVDLWVDFLRERL